MKVKISGVDQKLLKKMTEFINMVDSCKVLRTPWFTIWFKWRGWY